MKVKDRNTGAVLVDTSIKYKRRRKRFPWFKLLICVVIIVYITFLGHRFYRSLNAMPKPEPAVIKAMHPDLRKEFYLSLVEEADTVRIDPRLAKSKHEKAVAFGKQHQVASTIATEKSSLLPQPRVLPAGATAKLVRAYRDDQVVWLEVTLNDATGGFLSGFNRVDFELFHGDSRIHRLFVSESIRNGKIQHIAVLLDHSGSTTGTAFDAMTQAVTAFIKQTAPTSRLKIWAFASHARPINRWSLDQAELIDSIRTLRPDGGTALFVVIRDAIDDSALLAHPGSIVLFTDGTDTSEGPLPSGILNKAIANRIPIHVVALRTGETNEQLLRNVATQTGGGFYMADRPDQLLQQFANVAATLSTPVYRLAILEPIPSGQTLKLKVGELQPISVSIE